MILSKIKLSSVNKPIITQRIKTKCCCGKEWESILLNQIKGIKKYGRDLCRGCKQKEQIKNGIRGKQYKNAGKAYKKKYKGKKLEEIVGIEKAKSIKEKLSRASTGKNNANYGGIWYGVNPNINTKGKTFEEIYGEERGKHLRKIRSERTSGKNNPMYGKPSPKGSGNGWSGWYKGWFFRSLMELSYMINVIERFNLKWKSAETKKYKIEYKDRKGNDRTYHPDFIINEKFLIEIKPKSLHNSELVQLKKEAAIIFCEENNFIYKLTYSPKTLSLKEIKIFVEEQKIKFIKRYQEKYNDLITN